MAQKKKKRQKLPGYLWLLIAAGIVIAVGGYFADGLIGSRAGADYAYTHESASALRISEVMTANQSAAYTAAGKASDWIELQNTGAQAVDLTGCRIVKASDLTAICVLPAVRLEAGACAVVYCDNETTGAQQNEIHAPFKLSASGETLTLLDAKGAMIEQVEVPSMHKNEAYVRIGDDWSVSTVSTPGEPNAVAAGTTVSEETAQSTVVVSEVMAGNVTYAAPDGGYYDYIELYNQGGQAVSLKGCWLSDSRSDAMKWQFPDVSVPSGGYVVVWCTGTDSKDPNFLQADIKLSSGGESVVLTDDAGRTMSAVDFPELAADQSYSLYNGGYTTMQAPTPGCSNDVYGAAQMMVQIDGRNTTGIYISEVMASTSKASYDWVEIYNSTGQAVDISGWGLSDKATSPRRWQFPNGTVIQAYAYMGVYMSGMEGTGGGMVNASFRLGVDGGYSLSLCDGSGAIVDRMYIPEQYAEVSYGRVLGQAGYYYFDAATPGSMNVSGYAGRAAMAKPSVEGGLFDTSDVLTVSLDAGGARIYYTTDGSEPTENSNPYTGPLQITSTTILRTRSYADGWMPSMIDTQSYLFGTNHTMYVVSLVSENDNLFGENGIYDNYSLTKEVAGHIEVFYPDGSGTMLSQGCGIKLHGDFSRKEKQKAFKIYARSEYGGGSTFQAPLIGTRDYTEYSSFLLRSSGQDTDKTRMRDSVLTALAADTSVFYQETDLCVVYINGQYWGHYNIREHITAHSICQFEGWEGQEDDIDLIKANNTVFQGSNETFEDLLTWVKNNDTNTDAAYQRISSVIDVQNFIEYMAIEIYTGNTDTLNVKRYRNPNADGLWKWVLYDLDWALTVDTDSLNRWLTPGGMGNEKRTDNTLFIACMKNDTFKDQFLTYFGEKLATDFSTENVMAKFKARYELLEPELPAQLDRWSGTQKGYQASLKEITDYVTSRPGLILQRAQKTLKFTDEQMEHYFGAARAKIEEG